MYENIKVHVIIPEQTLKKIKKAKEATKATPILKSKIYHESKTY